MYSESAASEKVISSLVALILQREMSFSCHVVDAHHRAKSVFVASKLQAMEEIAASVCNPLSSELKHIISLSREKGASSWLSALPVQEHGFA